MYRKIGTLLLTALIISSVSSASDSLRTVGEFGRRVFRNLLVTDTVAGNDILDSGLVNRLVRDAVLEVGSRIGAEKAKTITTTSGTMGYQADAHFDSLRAVMLKKGRYSELISFGTFDAFSSAYDKMAHSYDTGAYEFCAIHGDSIYLYPVPASTDTIYLFYWGWGKTPSAAADTVDLPHELYNLVEYWATVKAAAVEQNPERMQTYLLLYKTEEQKYLGGKTPQ